MHRFVERLHPDQTKTEVDTFVLVLLLRVDSREFNRTVPEAVLIPCSKLNAAFLGEEQRKQNFVILTPDCKGQRSSRREEEAAGPSLTDLKMMSEFYCSS